MKTQMELRCTVQRREKREGCRLRNSVECAGVVCVLETGRARSAKSRRANCYRQTEQPDWLQSLELLLMLLLLGSIRAFWPVGFGHSRTDVALLFSTLYQKKKPFLRSGALICVDSLCKWTQTHSLTLSSSWPIRQWTPFVFPSNMLFATCRLLCVCVCWTHS